MAYTGIYRETDVRHLAHHEPFRQVMALDDLTLRSELLRLAVRFIEPG